ncbi:uncharacterized protein TNCV_4691061 [Trichonephila clavipes]|nr:uncharacterized protein TNCV_4691061 [Trichonephila clavipes]
MRSAVKNDINATCAELVHGTTLRFPSDLYSTDNQTINKSLPSIKLMPHFYVRNVKPAYVWDDTGDIPLTGISKQQANETDPHSKDKTMSHDCGSPVDKVPDHGRHVMSSSPVPLNTRRIGQRCTLNLSRAQTSFRWCGVVVRRGGASSGVIHVT